MQNIQNIKASLNGIVWPNQTGHCPLRQTWASRNYATSTEQKKQKIKVPLALFGGSGNYASALYIAAVKANVLEKVESEIVDLVEATNRSPKFLEFTKDLSVPKDSRVKAIQAICDDSKFSDITKSFLVKLWWLRMGGYET